MKIDDLAFYYGWDSDNNFARVCFNDHTIEGLESALREKRADHDDCEAWKITPTQWRECIRAALEDLKIFRDWVPEMGSWRKKKNCLTCL